MTETKKEMPSNEETNNWRAVGLGSGLLLLCFSLPLYRLVRFSIGHELYSHLVLIPFISAYLVWLKRRRMGRIGTRLSPTLVALLLLAGGGLLAGFFFDLLSVPAPAPQDVFALAVYALVLSLSGVCAWFLDRLTLRALAFPLGFLIFMAPFPVRVEAALETFLQHGSAAVANVFFDIIGTPVFRDGTFFQLPSGFHMQVAPECSGIHSTLALFVTSLVAGQVLLRSNWSRTVLAVAVLPIALLRNGLRVTTIGELCVRIGPEMIDSYIHRHGGPIFFLISLIPFSLLLLLLLKLDRQKQTLVPASS